MNPSEIRALARLVDRVDYYKLLRVERDASATRIRAAYHDARRRFHPDAFFSASTEVREAVDRIARRVTEAYTVLRDTTRRAGYDAALREGALRYDSRAQEAARTKEEERSGSTPNGRRFFTLSTQEERRGDVTRAISHLKMALTFEPGNQAFKRKLAALEKRKAS